MFSLEKDVVKVLDANINHIFGEGRSVLEFSCGVGRPDIMFGRMVNNNDRESIADYDSMLVLSTFCVRKGQLVTADRIRESTNFSGKKIDEIIKLLSDHEYIKQSSTNKYVVTRRYEPPVQDFISIEVKMKDWRQGYYQAVRYSSFSTKSYLAISSEYINNVDIEVLRKDGIGLISVGSSTAKILVLAKKIKHNNKIAHYLSTERFRGCLQ